LISDTKSVELYTLTKSQNNITHKQCYNHWWYCCGIA